jgi:hypothetical protein
MSASFCRKAGTVGALVSLGALPISVLSLVPGYFLTPQLRMLLLVCGFSFLSGFIATCIQDWRSVSAKDGVRLGLACGSRTGMLSSIMTAAFIVMGNTLAMRGKGGVVTPDFLPLLSAFMSIIPGIISGIIGGVAGVIFRSPASFVRNIPNVGVDVDYPQKLTAYMPRIRPRNFYSVKVED